MVDERAYRDEDRQRYERERREEGYGQDWERRRWNMAKGYTEREYDERAAERAYPEPMPEWMRTGRYSGVGPRGYRRDDAAILEDVSERLTEHGDIDASDIEVEVHGGEVLYRGRVNSRYAKRAAENAAYSVRGVRDVRNELRIGEREGVERRREPYQPGLRGATGQEPYRPKEEAAGRREEPERPRHAVGHANLSVFSIYRGRPAVKQAVDALRSAGFRNTDISVLFAENEGTKDFAFEKGTKAPEGVTAGAGSGIVVGGVLGWLAGVGLLAVPGIGPFVAAGPIISTLAGMGIAGTIGGIAGALIGMGMPEYEAKRYEGRVKGGHILLSVHCDDRTWAGRAERILSQTGGEDIARAGEKSADFAATDRPLPRGAEYRQE
jgi:hypothetical protein